MSKKSRQDVWGEYVQWLFKQIDVPAYYNMLLWALMDKPWNWFLDWDTNAVAHARNLRVSYIWERYPSRDFEESKIADETLDIISPEPIAFLEVLVALAVLLEMHSYGGYSYQWARILLGNLDLLQYKGNPTMEQFREIDEKVERCIWRTYEPNGQGGFFPLREPKKDQREADLWQQLNAYVHENPYGPASDRQPSRN